MNAKRVFAIVGIITLLALYVVTLILAFSKDPNIQQWFIACIVGTICIPILIYVFQWLYKKIKKGSEEATTKNYIIDDEKKD